MIFKESTQLGLMHLKVPLIPFYFKEPGSCILYSVCLGPPKFRLKLESRYRVVSKQVHWSAGTEVSVFTEGHRNQGNPCAFCSPTMWRYIKKVLTSHYQLALLVLCDLYNCWMKSSPFEESCYSSRSERRHCLTWMTFPAVKPNTMCPYLFVFCL